MGRMDRTAVRQRGTMAGQSGRGAHQHQCVGFSSVPPSPGICLGASWTVTPARPVRSGWRLWPGRAGDEVRGYLACSAPRGWHGAGRRRAPGRLRRQGTRAPRARYQRSASTPTGKPRGWPPNSWPYPRAGAPLPETRWVWLAGSAGTTRGAAYESRDYLRASADLPGEVTEGCAGVVAGGVATAGEAADAADEAGLPVTVLCGARAPVAVGVALSARALALPPCATAPRDPETWSRGPGTRRSRAMTPRPRDAMNRPRHCCCAPQPVSGGPCWPSWPPSWPVRAGRRRRCARPRPGDPAWGQWTWAFPRAPPSNVQRPRRHSRPPWPGSSTPPRVGSRCGPSPPDCE